MDDVIEIARVMRDRSCARDLSGTIKEILGTCVSVGCTVDHEEPRDLQQKVRCQPGPVGTGAKHGNPIIDWLVIYNFSVPSGCIVNMLYSSPCDAVYRQPCLRCRQALFVHEPGSMREIDDMSPCQHALNAGDCYADW